MPTRTGRADRAQQRPMEATAHALYSDFERRVIDGRRHSRHNQPIPALDGGAYAVGFLFGYQGERRGQTHRP
jgi:hypothetical protein